MTASKAIELADEMRPNNPFGTGLKQLWLKQADAALRSVIVDRSETEDFDGRGADRAWDDEAECMDPNTLLLAPVPFDRYYPHYLCAWIDLALGETTRYANEMQLANAAQAEFAAWCRRNYMPRGGAQWAT